MPRNLGDFQMGVYLDAVEASIRATHSTFSRSNARRPRRFLTGCTDTSRRPPETANSAREHRRILTVWNHSPDDGQPVERDLSITLLDKHFDSPIFMCPIGLDRLVRA
jgi:hypothetical protein